MMKKLLAVSLSTMMVLSMSACGGSDSSADTTAAQETEAEVTVETEAETEETEELPDLVDVEGATIWDILRVETPDLTNTSWGLSGGYIEGEEMTQEDLDQTLEQYGGQLDFNFGEDGQAQMVQGGGTMEGSYEYLDDGVSVVFDNQGAELPYTCLFTEMNDTLVLVAVPDESGTSGLYFSQN